MERFILQKSQERENWWVFTDTLNGVVIQFEHGKFNETQKVTMLNDVTSPDASKIARILRDMGEWLAQNHYDKAVQYQPTFDRNFYRKEVGMKLRDAREKSGKSVREVSEETGINISNLSRIENGKYNYGIDMLNKLAKCYGKSVKLD